MKKRGFQIPQKINNKVFQIPQNFNNGTCRFIDTFTKKIDFVTVSENCEFGFEKSLLTIAEMRRKLTVLKSEIYDFTKNIDLVNMSKNSEFGFKKSLLTVDNGSSK